MFPDWTVIVGLMLGATFGSFLNVVIYRMPRLLSLGQPKHSFCPNCQTTLGMRDLIPLLSWLGSKGKCQHCGVKIPSRYFWVELITGLIWALIWWRYFVAVPYDAPWETPVAYMIGSAALVAIIFIDFEHYMIPDEINAFLLVLGLIYHAANGTLKSAMLGWLAGWGIIFFIAVLGRIGFGKDAMGHGDIKMMRGVGALLGPALTFATCGIAVFLGAVIGTALLMLFSKRGANAPVDAALAESPEPHPGAPGVAPNREPGPVPLNADPNPEPEPIRELLLLGFTYLLALDVFAIWFPKIYTSMGFNMEPVSVEEDDWTPDPTAIPFGPYLALGAIVCMVLRVPIEDGLKAYWSSIAGNPN